jgi:hypothetical protein
MADGFDPTAEKEAVYKTLLTLLHTIETKDVSTIRRLVWPNGHVVRSRNREVSYLGFSEFTDQIETQFLSTQHKLSEILHDESYQILCISPDFAVIWFASTLLVDDVPESYIGNAMGLHKRDGKWKFSILADSGISLNPGQNVAQPTSPTFKNEGEEEAIRKVMSTFFNSLAELNVDGIISTIWALNAGAAMSQQFLNSPNPDLILMRFSDFIHKFLVPMLDPNNPPVETFDNCVVLVHDNIAVAVGESKIFRGKEKTLWSFGWVMFTFLKVDGAWKISSVAETHQQAKEQK